MARVVVTGGAGFIGAHLVSRLVERGDDVVVLDNLRRGRREALEPHLRQGTVRLVEGDIRELDTLRPVLCGCDVVHHLAAQSNVMGALENPDYSVTTNVLGTFNVLRAAAEAGVRRVVFASSREVYGEPRTLPAREDAPLLARSLYGASKVAGEAYCRTFAATHDMGVEVLRLANVYGPGDRDRVIPRWLTAAQRGRDLEVYGGDPLLDFVWIDAAVDALVMAAEHGVAGPTNVASGVGTRLVALAERVRDLTGSRSAIVRAPARALEVERFVADTARMRSLGVMPEGEPLRHLPEIVTAYA